MIAKGVNDDSPPMLRTQTQSQSWVDIACSHGDRHPHAPSSSPAGSTSHRIHSVCQRHSLQVKCSLGNLHTPSEDVGEQ